MPPLSFLPYRRVGNVFRVDFARGHDSLYLLQLDNFLEEVYVMKLSGDFTQEEVADLVACIDAEITSCERRASAKGVFAAVAKAFRDRGEALKLLRSKVVHKP